MGNKKTLTLKTSAYPAQVSYVKCFCNICETGEMLHTEIMIGEQYEHECNRCRNLVLLDNKFPHYKFEYGTNH